MLFALLIACGTSTGPDGKPSKTTAEVLADGDKAIMESRLRLAALQLQNDDMDAARATLMEVLEKDPGNIDAKTAVATIDIAKKNQSWQVTDKTDEMEGSRVVILAVEATDSYIYHTRERKRPTMYIRCKGGKLEAYINNDAQADDAYDGVTVKVKFGEGKPISLSADESTDHEALFIGKPKTLVAGFSGQTTMLYQFTPFSSAPATLHFNVSGWDEKAAPLKEACKLK